MGQHAGGNANLRPSGDESGYRAAAGFQACGVTAPVGAQAAGGAAADSAESSASVLWGMVSVLLALAPGLVRTRVALLWRVLLWRARQPVGS